MRKTKLRAGGKRKQATINNKKVAQIGAAHAENNVTEYKERRLYIEKEAGS